MTQTGRREAFGDEPYACQWRIKSGLTAPGLVNTMTFKGGEVTSSGPKIPFYFAHSFYRPDRYFPANTALHGCDKDVRRRILCF